jgi:hypothetical protein
MTVLYIKVSSLVHHWKTGPALKKDKGIKMVRFSDAQFQLKKARQVLRGYVF